MKVKNLFKYGFISLIASSIAFTSCKYEEPSAPRSVLYITASEDFEFESFSTDASTELDFTQDSLKFDAEFNENVTWTITITGNSHETDHAERVLSGTSKDINPEEIFWDGASDNVYFFKKGEPLTIELSVLGVDETIVWTDYSVSKTKAFNANVILNFEKNLDTDNQALLRSPNDINSFFDLENKDEYLDSAKFSDRDDLPTAVQGTHFTYLKGQDIVGQPGSFFIGGFNNNPTSLGITSSLEDTYFNMYANSNGNKTTKIVILITGIGGDKFKAERNVIWDGWRLVSVKLSDFILGEAGALGTGVLFPDQIKTFNIEIHSGDGAGKEAELLADFICITEGTPFRQSN